MTKIKIEGSTIKNTGILNLGEINGNVSQTIQQSAENQNELKELIAQLQTLINSSSLPKNSKQKALSKTQELVAATEKEEAEQKTIVQKTLGYFAGLSDSLEDGTEIAIKLAETIAKITLAFGL